jgi:hypothetical protein
MVVKLIRDYGSDLIGSVVSGPSETLYFIHGVGREGFSVTDLEDVTNSRPQRLTIPPDAHVNFPSESSLIRLKSRIEKEREKRGLEHTRQMNPQGEQNHA